MTGRKDGRRIAGRVVAPAWLPDWRDASAYEWLELASPTVLAWQFLRRNADYQRAFEELSGNRAFLPPEPNQTWRSYSSRLAAENVRLPACNQCDESVGMKFRISPRPYDPALLDPPVTFELDSASKEPPWIDLGFGSQVPIGDSRVGLIFDLEWPLERQLDAASWMLSEVRELWKNGGLDDAPSSEKNKRKGQVTKVRRTDLSLYLRLLDAEAVAARPAEWTAVLCPGMDDSYPDCPQTKRLRQRLHTATMLRDSGYAELAYQLSSGK